MASPNSGVEMSLAALSKMKVAEIKKELKARGLNTSGTKTELVERLHSASQTAQDLNSEDGNAESEMLDEDEVLGGVEEGGEEFDDDDDLTADAELAEEAKVKTTVSPTTLATKRPAPLPTETSQEVQPKKRVLVRPISVSSGKENGLQEKNTELVEQEKTDSHEKKVVKLSAITVKERLELRAQKFGVTLSDTAKKEARAERFGMSSTPSKTSGNSTSIKVGSLSTSEEVLKKRAERFGGNVSSLALKVEEKEKLLKRQERFGGSEASATNLENKKKLRAERFKL